MPFDVATNVKGFSFKIIIMDYKWIAIENSVTMIVAGVLFYLTNNGWCFLILLNLTSITTRK